MNHEDEAEEVPVVVEDKQVPVFRKRINDLLALWRVVSAWQTLTDKGPLEATAVIGELQEAGSLVAMGCNDWYNDDGKVRTDFTIEASNDGVAYVTSLYIRCGFETTSLHSEDGQPFDIDKAISSLIAKIEFLGHVADMKLEYQDMENLLKSIVDDALEKYETKDPDDVSYVASALRDEFPFLAAAIRTGIVWPDEDEEE